MYYMNACLIEPSRHDASWFCHLTVLRARRKSRDAVWVDVHHDGATRKYFSVHNEASLGFAKKSTLSSRLIVRFVDLAEKNLRMLFGEF